MADLKHYKSGDVRGTSSPISRALTLAIQIGLRWRTEEEVLARTGELTCSAMRCKHHLATNRSPPPSPAPSNFADRRRDRNEAEVPLVGARLTPFQLDFAYSEVSRGLPASCSA